MGFCVPGRKSQGKNVTGVVPGQILTLLNSFYETKIVYIGTATNIRGTVPGQKAGGLEWSFYGAKTVFTRFNKDYKIEI